jgi:transcriptional regulator with XRE-family HTH domain
MAKLTKAKVKKIKQHLAENKLTQPEIAKKFKVSRSLVSNIATGRAHKDVEGPEAPPKAARGQRKKLPDYDPTDERVLELEADVVHLREERNHARLQLKAASKSKGLFEAMSEEMERVVQPYSALPPARKAFSKAGKASVTEHLVLHISDGHHDQTVVPEECGGLERYNFPTSVVRGEKLIDTVLKWTQQTLAPQFRFPELTVLAYGDHTSGEIHGAVNRSYFKNQFKNSLAIGQFHALMYRDLAPYFDMMNVVYVPGNHGRRSLKKNHHGAHDNWDYLVAKTAEMYCADMPNVHFTIPNSFSVNLDICGNGFCVFHGDDIRSNMGIPWYGLERRQRRYAALGRVMKGVSIRYFCCGHFHRPGSVSEVDGELLINGPWVATDAYAYNALSAYSEPTQLLHGVNEKHGITWRLPIKLKDDVREQSGPKRYKIDLFDEVV